MNPKVSVWRAVLRLGNLPVRYLLWPEGIYAVLMGVGGAIAVIQTTKLTDRLSIVGDVLPLAAALLAVVFTALALVVSIPSRDYIRLMAETPNGGMLNFLDPFLVAVGTQTAVVVLALTYKLAASNVSRWIEHVGFGVISFLFVFGLLDVVAVARSLVRHGLNRADAVLNEESEPVARLEPRRGSNNG